MSQTLRAAGGGISKDEGGSREHWMILRDAASLLLRMRSEIYEPAFQEEMGIC